MERNDVRHIHVNICAAGSEFSSHRHFLKLLLSSGTGYRLQATGYRLQATGYRLQIFNQSNIYYVLLKLEGLAWATMTREGHLHFAHK